MKLAIDVSYRDTYAVAAGIGFLDWSDDVASHAATVSVDAPADYEPGSFYKRELPPILALLDALPFAPELVIVDAYVDLGDRPGLGRYLHEAIAVPVIGVAKSPYAGAPAVEVLRGGSTRPLFVTAAGMDAAEAAARIRQMHGPARLPTLIAAADRLASHG